MKQIKNISNSKNGFTLIEMMISTALFVVIITMGIGAVLNVTKAHKQSAELRQAMDTIYFSMEDITRNVRLGSRFRSDTLDVVYAQDCPINIDGSACSLELVFENYIGDTEDNNDQYVYRLSPDVDHPGYGYLEKSTDTGAHWLRMTPSNILIDLAKSGFIIENSAVYPILGLRFLGKATYQGTSIPFNIQTTISPRSSY